MGRKFGTQNFVEMNVENKNKHKKPKRNDEQADFRNTWIDLYELMLSEVRRTRRTLYTEIATW